MLFKKVFSIVFTPLIVSIIRPHLHVAFRAIVSIPAADGEIEYTGHQEKQAQDQPHQDTAAGLMVRITLIITMRIRTDQATPLSASMLERSTDKALRSSRSRCTSGDSTVIMSGMINVFFLNTETFRDRNLMPFNVVFNAQ